MTCAAGKIKARLFGCDRGVRTRLGIMIDGGEHHLGLARQIAQLSWRFMGVFLGELHKLSRHAHEAKRVGDDARLVLDSNRVAIVL